MSRHITYNRLKPDSSTEITRTRFMTSTARLFVNCRAATMAEGAPYGLIEDAAILTEGGLIRWFGPRADAPAAATHDLGGRLVTPALIDCHTHVVHGGHRAAEFEMRLHGAGTAGQRLLAGDTEARDQGHGDGDA